MTCQVCGDAICSSIADILPITTCPRSAAKSNLLANHIRALQRTIDGVARELYDITMTSSRSKKSDVPRAILRADEDIKRGDYALARERLTSLLATRGYDSELLDRIGDICFEMKDLSRAGRYWFLSARTDDETERVIEIFLSNSGSTPDRIVQQLPRHALQKRISDYPERVQARIEFNRLGDAIERAAKTGRKLGDTPSKTEGLRSMITCLTVLAVIAAVFVAGLSTIFHWIFGG